MSSLVGRRVSIFGSYDMKMLDISKRPGRPWPPESVSGQDVLPWIERYTEGAFYLSDYSIGFREPGDLIIFKLAFKV